MSHVDSSLLFLEYPRAQSPPILSYHLLMGKLVPSQDELPPLIDSCVTFTASQDELHKPTSL